MSIVFTLLRIAATVVGYVTVLMWLAGVAGLADFSLSFVVPEAAP